MFSFAAQAEDFYDPPAVLPSENGALIRQEPSPLASLALIGQAPPLNGVATRIMYRSTDDQGQPVAITGTYIEPNVPWNGAGPRPLVSYAVVSEGVGDSCAPSKKMGTFVRANHGKVGTNNELISIDGFIRRGIAVVVTDYLGLGTTDRLHTYVDRVDQGHAMLDAARAALALPGVSLTASSPIGLYGYSQGGSAAGAAAELAASYAPELPIRAAYVGGPVSNMLEAIQDLDGSLLTGVIAWEINGLFSYHPELQGQLDEITNSKGKQWLEGSRDQCLSDAISESKFRHTAEFTRSGASLLEVIQGYPDILALLDAQRLGRVSPTFPVMVLAGTHDDLVGYPQARQVAIDWCSKGGNVTYQRVDQLLPATPVGLNHLLPAFTEANDAQDWLADQFLGVPARPNCETL